MEYILELIKSKKYECLTYDDLIKLISYLNNELKLNLRKTEVIIRDNNHLMDYSVCKNQIIINKRVFSEQIKESFIRNNDLEVDYYNYYNMMCIRYVMHEIRHGMQNLLTDDILGTMYKNCFLTIKDDSSINNLVNLMKNYYNYVANYDLYITEVNAELYSIMYVYKLCEIIGYNELKGYLELLFNEKFKSCYNKLTGKSYVLEFYQNNLDSSFDNSLLRDVSKYDLLMNGLNVDDKNKYELEHIRKLEV